MTSALVLASPLPVTQIPTADHVINVTGSGSGHITLGPSGAQFQNIPGASFTGTTTLQNPASSTNTAVNKNSALVNLDTAGKLTIHNFHSSVTELSFAELIPLVTA